MGCTTSKSSKKNDGITDEQYAAQTVSTQQNYQNENYTLKNRFDEGKPQIKKGGKYIDRVLQQQYYKKFLSGFKANINMNASKLQSSMCADKQNSLKTQAIQYIEMIKINNFQMSDPEELIVNYQTKNIAKIPNYDYFKKYKFHQFIQQNQGLLNNLKQPKETAQFLKQSESKIKAANYDLKQCGKDIALYILTKNSIGNDDNYDYNPDHNDHHVQQQKSQVDLNCTVQSKIEVDEDDGVQNNNQLKNDEIEKVVNHLALTGQKYFYYSLPIINDPQFSSERAQNEKEQFGQHVKEGLTKQYENDVPKIGPDKILILEVIYNPLTVNYISDLVLPDKNRVYIGQQIKINENYLDPKWNMTWDGGVDKRGQIKGKPKEYYLPSKLYYGLGLNIVENYPKDGWFGSGHDDKTWIVLYHKQADFSMDHFKSQNNSANSQQQKYSNDDCRFGRGKVGHGMYLADKIENCENHGNNSYIKIGDKKYEFIYQCRANPKTIKSPKSQPNIFVANNPKDIRPYRLLIRQVE